MTDKKCERCEITDYWFEQAIKSPFLVQTENGQRFVIVHGDADYDKVYIEAAKLRKRIEVLDEGYDKQLDKLQQKLKDQAKAIFDEVDVMFKRWEEQLDLIIRQTRRPYNLTYREIYLRIRGDIMDNFIEKPTKELKKKYCDEK